MHKASKDGALSACNMELRHNTPPRGSRQVQLTELLTGQILHAVLDWEVWGGGGELQLLWSNRCLYTVGANVHAAPGKRRAKVGVPVGTVWVKCDGRHAFLKSNSFCFRMVSVRETPSPHPPSSDVKKVKLLSV